MTLSKEELAMTRNDERSTNEHIAELILSQTYEERVGLAKYLSNAATDLVQGENVPIDDLDVDYFATLLFGWAENNVPGEPS